MTGERARHLAVRPATALSLLGLARMGLAARRFLIADLAAPPLDVRVVVPARNESAAISRCVSSLRRQASQVVVVDDASEDDTAARAKAAGAGVLRLENNPPPGWLGKPRACAAGAYGARTEWLAFVDADVELHPCALASMATAASRAGSSSISIAGGLECRTFAERLLLVELGLTLAAEGFPTDFASGQCFLVRRNAYERSGGHGHRDVRASAVDDRDLAHLLGGHQARLAPSLMQARMYEGFADLRAGLVKNQASLHPDAAAHLLWLLGPVATRRPWAAMVVSAGGRMVAGHNPLYGLLAPLARLGLAGLYLESRWRSRLGAEVMWKGRPVPVPGGRTGSA